MGEQSPWEVFKIAEYDKRLFYWLIIKENFFDEDAIEWLEEQPNGIAYCYFYLKLCVKSLKTNGLLIRKVGEFLIPYDTKKLAEITKTDIDTVRVAMELLKNIGLIKVLDNGTIYLTQLENMIGKKSVGALKKQQQRQLTNMECGQIGDNCPPEIELDIDIDKELDIDIPQDKPAKPKKHKYGEYKNVLLTDKDIEKLKDKFSDWEARIENLSQGIELKGYKYKNHYLAILKWAEKDGKKTVKKDKEVPPPAKDGEYW